MAWEGERGGFFFALVTAGRIRDRIFLIDSPPKKLAQIFFGYFKLVRFVIVDSSKVV